jgi:hypothetical protein
MAVSLAALVLLAGCGALPLGSDPGPAIPPGLSENGVQDASALASAHREILRDQSRTVEVTETIRYENGSLRGSKRATYRVDPASGIATAVVEPTVSGGLFAPPFLPSAATLEFYRNGTTVLAKVTNDTTSKRLPVQGTEGSLRSPKMVPTLLTATNLQYNGTVKRDGETLYCLEATAPEDEALVAKTVLSGRRYDELRNVTFRALVTDDGLVRKYTVEYAVFKTEGYKFPETEEGQVIRGTRTVTFESVGTTSVERPAWAGNQSAA